MVIFFPPKPSDLFYLSQPSLLLGILLLYQCLCSCRKLELTTREIQAYNGCINSQIPGVWSEWKYNTFLPIPPLPAWMPFSKPKAPLRVCTGPLGTRCRTVQMTQWGKFRSMSLQWSKDRAARGKISMSSLKAAALLGLLQSPPKAPFQDIAEYQIFIAAFNYLGTSDWAEGSILHIHLLWITCPPAYFLQFQEQCREVWDKLVQRWVFLVAGLLEQSAGICLSFVPSKS